VGKAKKPEKQQLKNKKESVLHQWKLRHMCVKKISLSVGEKSGKLGAKWIINVKSEPFLLKIQ